MQQQYAVTRPAPGPGRATSGWRVRRVAALSMLAAALAACAAGPPPPPLERVDERTAVTVTTLAKPLLYSVERGGAGQPLDLAVGPVETNRQGARGWYVWASLLGGNLGQGEPRLKLLAGGETLVELAPLPSGGALPFRSRPYPRPADWATERYYAVTPEELALLHRRGPLHVELALGDGTVRFEPWDASFEALDEYLATQLPGRVGRR